MPATARERRGHLSARPQVPQTGVTIYSCDCELVLGRARGGQSHDSTGLYFDVGKFHRFFVLHTNLRKSMFINSTATPNLSTYLRGSSGCLSHHRDVSSATQGASSVRAAAEGFDCLSRRQCTLPTSSVIIMRRITFLASEWRQTVASTLRPHRKATGNARQVTFES